MLKELIKKNRTKLNEATRSFEKRRFISPAVYSADRLIVPAILAHAHGNLIDIGCGDMPYRDLILSRVTRYDTLDIERRASEVRFLGDIHNMHMLSGSSYDSAVCLATLEHTWNPFQAMSEVARILKTDGCLILSVPHLSRLHEEPYDYFRYTKYGLQRLLESAGLEVVEIAAAGGIFSFLGHQLSTVLLCTFWHIPVLREIAFFLNKWLCVRPCYWLDLMIDKSKIFALGYVCVAKKTKGRELD